MTKTFSVDLDNRLAILTNSNALRFLELDKHLCIKEL